MTAILSVSDLSDEAVESILGRASQLRVDGLASLGPRAFVVSLIFLETSLRTRVGFAAAAARLGWSVIEVAERRHSEVSMMERWGDTLRTVAGYSDAIVARPGLPLGRETLTHAAGRPVINAGDTGPKAEHPSQALIDVFAMQELVGPLPSLRVAIVGDPRMRSVRSLLALMARRPPEEVMLVADEAHLGGVELPLPLECRVRVASWEELAGVSVAYVAGIPHEALPLARRELLLATAGRLAMLPASCVLLSPMPVVDEMDEVVRASSRNLMFLQSDLAIYVRMALLEYVVGGDEAPRGWPGLPKGAGSS